MYSKEEEKIAIKKVIDLANSFPDSSEFINHIEKSIPSSITEIEKANAFEYMGNILLQYSFFLHALFVWIHILKYHINLSDREGEGRCYGNIGLSYYSLGYFRKAIEYHEKSLDILKEIGNKKKN